MLGENLLEGAWFWKAPISEALLTIKQVNSNSQYWLVDGLTHLENVQ